jgi:ubiquinone/menaquinone biosynthesis C-methylase UbiE
MKKYPELYRNLAKIVKNHISVSSPVIIDLGSGPGLLSYEIFKLLPKSKIIGIDPSIEMINLSKKNTLLKDFKSFKIFQATSDKIPIKDKTVDLIVSRFSLPYWKKPQDSFNEINRVLKPKGKIILEALNKEYSQGKLSLIKFHMILKFASKETIKYHIDAYKKAYSINEVQQLLINTKFKTVDLIGNNRSWKFIIIAQK